MGRNAGLFMTASVILGKQNKSKGYPEKQATEKYVFDSKEFADQLALYKDTKTKFKSDSKYMTFCGDTLFSSDLKSLSQCFTSLSKAPNQPNQAELEDLKASVLSLWYDAKGELKVLLGKIVIAIDEELKKCTPANEHTPLVPS